MAYTSSYWAHPWRLFCGLCWRLDTRRACTGSTIVLACGRICSSELRSGSFVMALCRDTFHANSGGGCDDVRACSACVSIVPSVVCVESS